MLTFAPALRAKREDGTEKRRKTRRHVHRHIGLTALSTAMLKEDKRVRKEYVGIESRAMGFDFGPYNIKKYDEEFDPGSG